MRKWLSCKLAFALAAIVMMSLGCGNVNAPDRVRLR